MEVCPIYIIYPKQSHGNGTELGQSIYSLGSSLNKFYG